MINPDLLPQFLTLTGWLITLAFAAGVYVSVVKSLRQDIDRVEKRFESDVEQLFQGTPVVLAHLENLEKLHSSTERRLEGMDRRMAELHTLVIRDLSGRLPR